MQLDGWSFLEIKYCGETVLDVTFNFQIGILFICLQPMNLKSALSL